MQQRKHVPGRKGRPKILVNDLQAELDLKIENMNRMQQSVESNAAFNRKYALSLSDIEDYELLLQSEDDSEEDSDGEIPCPGILISSDRTKCILISI